MLKDIKELAEEYFKQLNWGKFQKLSSRILLLQKGRWNEAGICEMALAFQCQFPVEIVDSNSAS